MLKPIGNPKTIVKKTSGYCVYCKTPLPLPRHRGRIYCSDKCCKKQWVKRKGMYRKTPIGREESSYNTLLLLARKKPEYYRKRFHRFILVAKKMGWIE